MTEFTFRLPQTTDTMVTITDQEIEELLNGYVWRIRNKFRSQRIQQVKVTLWYSKHGVWHLRMDGGSGGTRVAWIICKHGQTPEKWVKWMIDSVRERAEYPQIYRVKEVKEMSQQCGQFLDWILGNKGLHLAQYHEHTDTCYDAEYHGAAKGDRAPYCNMYESVLYPANTTTEDLLYEFFGVDHKAFQREQDRCLTELRKQR